VSAARTVPVPEAIALSPDGKNAYVTSEGEGALSQFAISPVTGKITPLSPATITAPSPRLTRRGGHPLSRPGREDHRPGHARHGSARGPVLGLQALVRQHHRSSLNKGAFGIGVRPDRPVNSASSCRNR
jgi:hypothetical protein